MQDILKKWQRPVILPLPSLVNGVENPMVSLNGIWKERNDPADGFYAVDAPDSSWDDMPVPLDLQLPHNILDPDSTIHQTRSVYRRTVHIPEEMAGYRRLIRFDGANCYAKVYVNGVYLKDHYGGYVAWDCDITDAAQAGTDAQLTVEVVDKGNEISGMNRGGLMRDVTLYCVPTSSIERLQVETVLDEKYKNATLKVETRLTSAGKLAFTLTDPDGADVPLKSAKQTVPGGEDTTILFPVKTPKKWTSETPYLYTLTARLTISGKEVETVTKKIGFRVIERRGNQVFVNGQEIKLHGSCRHDVHPVTGCCVTPELVREDVKLFKEANCNFIRTSHYPPRPDFLDECDRVGIYVECETSVAFQGQGGRYSMDDPAYTAAYMGQWTDLIERDRSHACVIMWSLANESYWGSNFAEERDYAMAADPSRLTIFSYPITMPEDEETVDVWSLHYAGWDQDPSALGDNWEWGHGFGASRPVLHDEYIHIPCYDIADHKRDQGIRDYYGQSVKAFWDKIYDTKGALGGAIWAGIDHNTLKGTSSIPLEWGIIDGWRRKKPEHFLVRKAYSPIRIDTASLPAGDSLTVPVQNRHNHLNLSDVTIAWSVGESSGVMQGPKAAPRAHAKIVIPAAGKPGDTLRLSFTDPFGFEEDSFAIEIAPAIHEAPTLAGGDVRIVRDGGIRVEGSDFSVAFSGKTGLITEAKKAGKVVLTGGPRLNLVGMNLREWALDAADAKIENGCAVVTIRGGYGKIRVTFTLTIDGEGLIETKYRVDDMPYRNPAKMKLYSGWDFGGYEEVGVTYDLPEAADSLSWDKKTLWTDYPAFHIGRPHGTADRFRAGTEEPFGQEPGWLWKDDMRGYPLYGQYDIGRRGTKDFLSTKSGIYRASVGHGNAGVTALSDGSDSVRVSTRFPADSIVNDRDPRIKYAGNWIQKTDAHGSYLDTETWCDTPGDYCELTFTGTGVAWFGAKDMIGGIAKVTVDGAEKVEINLAAREHTAGIARGHEKSYGVTCYSIDGLEMGEHTIRIEPTGKHNPDVYGAYVFIDYFVVLTEAMQGPVELHINNAFSFPELTWGNWCGEPIFVDTGYENKVFLKLGV